jgi:hypothetical protein
MPRTSSTRWQSVAGEFDASATRQFRCPQKDSASLTPGSAAPRARMSSATRVITALSMSAIVRPVHGRTRYQCSATWRVVMGAVIAAISSVMSMPTAPNTSRSESFQ